MKWHLSLGLGQDNYRFHDHDKLAHYADAAADIEFRFPFGFKELEGIHSRTDFDLSLVKKDGLPELANEIIDDLKWDFNVLYDQKDAVGRRYRRQDANGTPFCITVDHDSLEDRMVTIRHRDTMEQERVAISDLKAILHKAVDMRTWLKKME